MIISRFISGLVGLWILLSVSVTAFYSPQHVMVDVTNDFGICTLQLIASKKENVAFSPYGLVSVALVLYEGSTGPSAAEIHNTLRLPWDREVTRVGFRDLHRYLKSYFSNDGFLRGLVLSKPNIGLRRNYTDLLQFYGFDVKTSPTPGSIKPTQPLSTTARPATSSTTGKPSITVPEKTTSTTTTKRPQTISTTQTTPKITTTPSPTSEKPEEAKLPEANQPDDKTTVDDSKPSDMLTTMALPLTSTQQSTSMPTTIVTPAITSTVSPPSTIATMTSRSTLPVESTSPSIQTTMKPVVSETLQTSSTTEGTTIAKSTESSQPETTLDVITMTEKMPNTPEMLSQVNLSALITTTSEPLATSEKQTTILTTEVPTSTNRPSTAEILPVTKPTDNIQSSTVLEMTDRIPGNLEIMSQVSESFQITTLPTSSMPSSTKLTEITTLSPLSMLTTTLRPFTSEPADSSQSSTTLEIVTMTNKKPDMPEILSQVNESEKVTTMSAFSLPDDPLTTVKNPQEPSIMPESITTRTTISALPDTTLGVVTMTDKKPNTPEILSQVNESENSTAITALNEQLTTMLPQQTSTATVSEPVTTEAIKTTQFITTVGVVTMTNREPNTSKISSQMNESEKSTTSRFTLPGEQLTSSTKPSPTSMTTLDADTPTTSQAPILTKPSEVSSTMEITTTNKPPNPLDEVSLSTTSELQTSMTSSEQMQERIETTTVNSQKPTTTPLLMAFSSMKTSLDPTTELLRTSTEVIIDPNKFTDESSVTENASSNMPVIVETTTVPFETTMLSENAVVPPETTVENTSSDQPQMLENLQEVSPPSDTGRLDNSIAPSTATIESTSTKPTSTGSDVSTTSKVDSDIPLTTESSLERTTVPTRENNDSLATATSTTNTPDPVDDYDDNGNGITRSRRSLMSTYKTPEQQTSGSNWVPHVYDRRWSYNPTNEFWFFTYDGGVTVPAHVYTSYLPFAYVPELSCLALQLPLDDPRYSILLLLPEDRFGLSDLLYTLQWCPVRAIRTHLKMTAVYAVVPAFTIVKHVNLVPALAKLGVHSIFDPFRADLSPMSSEPHLFVRTIEQVVTVSLRKYYDSNRWFEASPSQVQQHFVANHPFVYFVIDKETEVTLMAGTIVNPAAHNQ